MQDRQAPPRWYGHFGARPTALHMIGSLLALPVQAGTGRHLGA